jgi:hypothetical protein
MTLQLLLQRRLRILCREERGRVRKATMAVTHKLTWRRWRREQRCSGVSGGKRRGCEKLCGRRGQAGQGMAYPTWPEGPTNAANDKLRPSVMLEVIRAMVGVGEGGAHGARAGVASTTLVTISICRKHGK